MPIKRVVHKTKCCGSDPKPPVSQSLTPASSVSGIRARITLENRNELLKFWDPETLEWVLDNENLHLGDLVEWGMANATTTAGDDIDWAELDLSNSDEDDTSRSAPQDVYGVPMVTCEICGKVNARTRIPSCWFCHKKAHTSCLRWITREDPHKPGHFL